MGYSNDVFYGCIYKIHPTIYRIEEKKSNGQTGYKTTTLTYNNFKLHNGKQTDKTWTQTNKVKGTGT